MTLVNGRQPLFAKRADGWLHEGHEGHEEHEEGHDAFGFDQG